MNEDERRIEVLEKEIRRERRDDPNGPTLKRLQGEMDDLLGGKKSGCMPSLIIVTAVAFLVATTMAWQV